MARIADTFEIPDYEEPLVYNLMSKEQFNAEIEKGIEDIHAGRIYSADEIEAEMENKLKYKKGVIHANI